VSRAPAPAKINLSLVVGPVREDGNHELVTVYQRVSLSDRIAVDRSPALSVAGFAGDTLVRRALECVVDGEGASFSARIQKRLPVAAGLGGGSSDAATALRLANALRRDPYPAEQLRALARTLGADVPYFLEDGPQLGTGDGSDLEALELPQDYWVLLVLPRKVIKSSTAQVYAAFDARGGESGYEERRATGTSLAAIVVIAIMATLLQGAYGNVVLSKGLLVGVPAIAGVVLGTWIQQRVATETIGLLFAFVLIAAALDLVLR